jgi:hypothetical protein
MRKGVLQSAVLLQRFAHAEMGSGIVRFQPDGLTVFIHCRVPIAAPVE